MYTKVSAFRYWIDAVVREFDDKNITGIVDTECEPIDKNTKIRYKIRQQTKDNWSKKDDTEGEDKKFKNRLFIFETKKTFSNFILTSNQIKIIFT